MDKYLALREGVLAAARRALALGLFGGTSGNLSAFDGEDTVAITPSGVRYDLMEPRDVVLVSLSGAVINAAAGRSPSSETPMHLEIYKARSDIGAVVHTHSPYATAFAAAARRVPCALIEMVAFLGGDIPLAPFAMPGSAALGQSALAALERRHGCLLENHGALAVGADIEQALLRAEYVEDAAKICALAEMLGGIHELGGHAVSQMRGE